MIADAMTELADRLTAGGVRACLDRRDLNPPAVLVHPPLVRYRFAGAEADWTLLAVVPDTGTAAAILTLDALIGQVQAALGGQVVAAAPADVTTSDSGAPLPGYRLTFTADL